MSNAKPYEIGTKVCGAFELPSVAVKVGHVYTIRARIERPFYPGGRVVWFYALGNITRCNVYHEFLKPVIDSELKGRVA